MHGFNGQGSSQTCRGNRPRIVACIVARSSPECCGFRRNDRDRIPSWTVCTTTPAGETRRASRFNPPGDRPGFCLVNSHLRRCPPRTSNVSRIPENLGEIFRVAGHASPIYLSASSFAADTAPGNDYFAGESTLVHGQRRNVIERFQSRGVLRNCSNICWEVHLYNYDDAIMMINKFTSQYCK